MTNQKRLKDDIFNITGDLYVTNTNLLIKRRAVDNYYIKLDRLAHKLDELENEYITKYKESPRFWRKYIE
jgi:hypothetical protein